MRWFDDAARDVRYAARSLWRTPVATMVIVLTTAVAIGANTVVFSLLHTLVLRDLPVRNPAQLVEFVWQYPDDPPLNLFSLDDYRDYRDHTTVFSAMVGTGVFQADAAVAGMQPQTVDVACVTGNFLQELGVARALGRMIAPDDDVASRPAVAVVSWSFWKNAFNLEPGALGSHIDLSGAAAGLSATIVGVAEKSFSGVIVGHEPQLWLPAATCRTSSHPGPALSLIARLKDGISIQAAQAEMRVLDRPRIDRFAARDPRWRHVSLDVLSARAGLSSPLRQQFQEPLWALMVIAGALLLLACANIATLLLARGVAREAEMAIRVSLGARPLRIVREALTESLIVAGIGCVIGTALAYAAAPALLRIIIAGARSIGPRAQLSVSIDQTVLVFSAGLMLLAAVLFGLAPAIVAFVSDPVSALKGNAAGPTRTRRRFANGLVVAQVSLSLVLLSVSTLFVGHLAALRAARDLGFNRASVLLASFDASHAGLKPDQLRARYKDLLARLSAVPAIETAALSGTTPLAGPAGSRFLTAEGFHEARDARERVWINTVTPKYFAAYGTPVLAGRDFEPADEGRPPVAIVNESMARHYFAGRQPLGKYVTLDGGRQQIQIVGVVADAKYADVRTAAPQTIYLDAFQPNGAPGSLSLSIRTRVAPAALAADVRRAVADLLNGTPIRTTTLAEQVDAAIVPERMIATLSGFFGGLGMTLTAIGLYGLLAYAVARRTREIAIRMSLGASANALLGAVLRRALGLVVLGLAIGAPAAWWVKSIAAGLLQHVPGYGVTPIAAGAAITLAVSACAAYFPARRAARVDPLVALRSE